jgi:hypothetical protein
MGYHQLRHRSIALADRTSGLALTAALDAF